MLSYEQLASFHAPEVIARYTAKDVILYALAVGVGGELPATTILPFVYEKELCPLASFYNIIGWHDPSWLHGLKVDMSRLVHLSEQVDIMHPLIAQGEVVVSSRIGKVYDRGADKGLLVEAVTEVRNVGSATVMARTSSTLLCMGDGGLEGAPQAPKIPKNLHNVDIEAPTGTLQFQTRSDQAALYRLCGDLNPIHIDPVAAHGVGFDTPLLHGLCTLGIGLQTVSRAVSRVQQGGIQGFNGRFSAPVFPGEMLDIDYWDKGSKLLFQVRVGDRVAIKDGWVALSDAV